MQLVIGKARKWLSGVPNRGWFFGLFLVNLFFIFVLVVLHSQGIIPPKVPLFYGRPYGADQLANGKELFIPPLMAITICVFNTFFNKLLKDEFLQKILIGNMLVCTVLSLITVTKIVFLVGNL